MSSSSKWLRTALSAVSHVLCTVCYPNVPFRDNCKNPYIPEISYFLSKSTISKKSVPIVQALIKNHKKKDENGNYLSRLVVPAKNRTAGFPHVGQYGLRNILDKNMVDYERKTIKQASDLI
jgi:hypothetical protein